MHWLLLILYEINNKKPSFLRSVSGCPRLRPSVAQLGLALRLARRVGPPRRAARARLGAAGQHQALL